MTTVILPKVSARATNFLTRKLLIDTPVSPDYEELPQGTIRKMWDDAGPEKQKEALTALEAAYSYRERSSSNTLVMKGLVFGGFFALLAVQLSIGVAVTNPLFMVGAIYTCIGAWCVAMAFRPTKSQLNPKYTEDERKVKLQDGAFAQYREVGGREADQRSGLQRQRVWLDRAIKHLGWSLSFTAAAIVVQTIIMTIQLIICWVGALIALFHWVF